MYRSSASSISSGRTSGSSAPSNAASIRSSTASASFIPSRPKNLMPLSRAGLWEALMTAPAAARAVRTR